MNGPQAVNGEEPAESGSDDDNDNDNDGMDVDMAPTSSKGRTLELCCEPLAWRCHIAQVSSLNTVSHLLSGWCSGSRSKKAGKGQSSSRPASDFFADL